MNTDHLPDKGQRQLAEVLALMSAEDRKFCEALPTDPLWDGDERAFAWILENSDERCVVMHLLLPGYEKVWFHSHASWNQSTILSGGYRELWRPLAWEPAGQTTRVFKTGDQVTRAADEGHHLMLLDGLHYALTAFIVGPKIRERLWCGEYKDGVLGPVTPGFKHPPSGADTE